MSMANEGNITGLTDEALEAVAGGAMKSRDAIRHKAAEIYRSVSLLSEYLPVIARNRLNACVQNLRRAITRDPKSAKAILDSLKSMLLPISSDSSGKASGRARVALSYIDDLLRLLSQS